MFRSGKRTKTSGNRDPVSMTGVYKKALLCNDEFFFAWRPRGCCCVFPIALDLAPKKLVHLCGGRLSAGHPVSGGRAKEGKKCAFTAIAMSADFFLSLPLLLLCLVRRFSWACRVLCFDLM